MSGAASSDEAQTWTCPACTLVNESADRCCAACGRLRPGAEAVVIDHAECEEAVVALGALEAGGTVVGPEEQQPKRGTKSFAHLPNGDCMPHALALGTHYLLDRPVVKSADHTSLAAQMRSMLHAHMGRNWLSCCAVAGGLPWHTLVTLAHNAAVSEVERAQYDDWGSDPGEQKERWQAERADFYCGMPELLAYAELCHASGAPVSLRVWRQVAGKLQMMARVPELSVVQGGESGRPLLVLDLQLTGEMDSAAAHYKLLQSGSLWAGEPQKGGAKKRRR